MKIFKHHIRNIDHYLAGIPDGATFRIAAIVTPDLTARLGRAGFSPSPIEGETILPTVVGRTSRFNAEGRYITRRDLPKERRYVRTIYWTWQQWAGNGQVEEHSDTKDIYRDCYPRDHVPPPAVELTVMRHGDRWFVASPELQKVAGNGDHNKHVINLVLELFGGCEVLTDGLLPIEPPTVRRANWKFLPPGEYPWPRAKADLAERLDKLGAGTALVIMDRAEFLNSLGPDQIIVGAGGFSDYMAYTFPAHGIVIMEAVRRDNALYVFSMNWEQASQLTKAQIIQANVHLARVIHTKEWKQRVTGILAMRNAA
jgi:hypothetical protein